MESCYEKYVVMKDIVEVWKYEKLNTKGGGKREGEGHFREANYRQQMKKRRRTIRQLACTNFDAGSKFVTLTFADGAVSDYTDVKECNHYFKNFVLRLKRRYEDLKYLAVIEFQDKNGRGAVHYHMLCNLPYVSAAELANIWGGGFIKINAIEKVDNVGAYIVKYMTEDIADTRLQGEKGYLFSRNLAKPMTIRSWKEPPQVVRNMSENLRHEVPTFSAKYSNEHTGEIEYKQYNGSRSAAVNSAPVGAR